MSLSFSNEVSSISWSICDLGLGGMFAFFELTVRRGWLWNSDLVRLVYRGLWEALGLVVGGVVALTECATI